MARRTTTRERLVRTAAELFARQGYGQTGVNAIMRAAGATSGSFYHFFATKEDLLLAVLDRESELQDAMFASAQAAAGDPVGRLNALVAAHRQSLADAGFGAGSILAAAAAELSDSHPAVRARIEELYAARTSRLAALLGERGEALPRLVIAALDGAVLQARATRDAAPFDAIATSSVPAAPRVRSAGRPPAPRRRRRNRPPSAGRTARPTGGRGEPRQRGRRPPPGGADR